MNRNLKRHEILRILSEQYIKVELEKEGYNVLGVPYKTLEKELDCNDIELRLILSELFNSKEIKYHDAYNVIGVFALEKGLESYSNDKYLKIGNEEDFKSTEYDKLESEKDLRILENELTKSNLETNKYSRYSILTSGLIGVITLGLLLYQIMSNPVTTIKFDEKSNTEIKSNTKQLIEIKNELELINKKSQDSLIVKVLSVKQQDNEQ